MEHTQAQERKSGSPIHHALDSFEFIDLSLRLTLAPIVSESGEDGYLVGRIASSHFCLCSLNRHCLLLFQKGEKREAWTCERWPPRFAAGSV
jgi:hypothetical protein